MDGIPRNSANITLAKDTRFLVRRIGEKGIEVLAPELDATLYRVKVFIGFFVYMRKEADGRVISPCRVGVKYAKGAPRGVSGYREGVAATEGDATAFFESIRNGGLGSGI